MLIKRLPWISGCALILVMSFVITVTRTVHATGPCAPTCLNAYNWAWAHCYAIGCAPGSGEWWHCGTNGGVGYYSYYCLCSCDGHQCATGDNGTINPSCPPL